MSAIQLLEKIATNSKIREQIIAGTLESDIEQKLSSFISENEPTNPMYCLMFPAEDDEKGKEDDSPSEGEEKKDEISNYLN